MTEEVVTFVLQSLPADLDYAPDLIREMSRMALCIENAREKLSAEDYARFLESIQEMLKEEQA